MQAVILAAGEGRRMRPLTSSKPKPMLPVAGRPLLTHTLDAAVDAGADELVIVVGYEREKIINRIGPSHREVPVTYVTQSEPLGTAHALRSAEDELEGEFLVLNGDNLYDPGCIDRLFERGPGLVVYEAATPSNYGVVSHDDGIATDIVEKPAEPPSSLVNAGAYLFPAAALDWLDVPASQRGEHELTDVLDRVVDQFDVQLVVADRWLDVGRPWELLEANEWKLSEVGRELSGSVSPAAHVDGSVVVESGATVHPGSVITGPVLVQRGASVGPGAYVRGATLLGRGASVGHGVEVKNSVLMSEAQINHLSYLGDSVVGERVNVGAGTTVANLRHDEEPIRLAVKGDRVSTGRRKFGVVVGDDVRIGIDTALNAGVTLRPGATTAPGETVIRDR